MPQKRDSHGRFKAKHTTRNRAIGAAAIGTIAAIGGGAFAALRYGLVERILRRNEGHAAPDLNADAHPDGSKRAPDHFRPDGDAPVPKSERDALRPATVAAPRDGATVEETTVH